MQIREALTFDDVLLKPDYSNVLPADVKTQTQITKNIKLAVPLISAAMDTVTESAMAIAMAQNGGIGCIHKSMTIEAQVLEVAKVKKFESGMIVDPLTINPDATLGQALQLMAEHNISGIPVVEKKTGKLAGVLTNRDVRFAENMKARVKDLMTKDDLVTVNTGTSTAEAKKLLHRHRIEKLIVVDRNYKCVGLITVKDIEKARKFPNASKDKMGRLRVAAATGTGKDGIARAKALIEAEADIVVVDTAHGHSKGVIEAVKEIKKIAGSTQIIAGNIATKEAAKELIKAGADAVKVGIGPGSICTTRIIAGVGVPQLSAIMDVVAACKGKVPVIADGGVKYSGDLAKAIAAGADVIMVGSLLAGAEESPGEVVLLQGRSYKTYRGMGSLGAMNGGSADRYFQADSEPKKYVPEGVEGRVPYKGPVSEVVYQLVGGLRAAMGYTGNATIKEMQTKCKFVKITGAGLKESHAHDITITREAPNYRV